jgi:hypothetical protein
MRETVRHDGRLFGKGYALSLRSGNFHQWSHGVLAARAFCGSREGYAPAFVLRSRAERYRSALSTADRGRYIALLTLIGLVVEAGLETFTSMPVVLTQRSSINHCLCLHERWGVMRTT